MQKRNKEPTAKESAEMRSDLCGILAFMTLYVNLSWALGLESKGRNIHLAVHMNRYVQR